MIIDRLRSDQWYDVTDYDPEDDASGLDPYYAHVCDSLTGIGRVPLPVALLQEGATGEEARAWFRIWLARQTDDVRLRDVAGGFFRWQAIHQK